MHILCNPLENTCKHALAFHNIRMIIYIPEGKLKMFAGVRSNCIQWHCMLPSIHGSYMLLHHQLLPSSWNALSFCVAAGLSQWEGWQEVRGQKDVLRCLFSLYVCPAWSTWYNSVCLSSSPALLEFYIPADISRPRCGELRVLPCPSSVCSFSLHVSARYADVFTLVYAFGGPREAPGVYLYGYPPYFWDRSHSLNVELRLGLLQVPKIHLSLPAQYWGYKCVQPCPAFTRVLGIQTLGLMLAQQSVCLLSHLPSLFP